MTSGPRFAAVAACSLAAASLGAVGCSSENPTDDSQQPSEPGIGEFADSPADDEQAVGTGDGSDSSDGADPTGGGAASSGTVSVVAPPNQDVTDVIVENEADQAQSEAEQNMECASSSEGTELQDVVLAFAFDVSGSMGIDENDRLLKWEPVIAATKAFFEDQASDGLLATLTFFPSSAAGAVGGGGGGGFGGGGGGGGGGASCESDSYETPDVGLTALPSTDFSAAIDGVEPNRLGTPTMPVLEGTIANVQAMAAEDTSNNYVIVLVTDGVPTTCSDDQNDISNVAAVAGAVAGEIPTYVIGVDTPDGSTTGGDPDADGVANLNMIAEQGGTEQAFIIDTGDPEKTSADFKAVVEQIRESAFTCNVQIPDPPEGQVFDKDKVNVSYNNMMGTTELTYDPECDDQFGWHYDNADDPTIIEMCTTVCEDIKADISNQGQLSVEFGCELRISGTR